MQLCMRDTDLCLDVVRRFGVSDWIHTAPGILAAEILSDFALDIFTGNVRSVGHVLLELLSS